MTHILPGAPARPNRVAPAPTRGIEDEIASAYQSLIGLHRALAEAPGSDHYRDYHAHRAAEVHWLSRHPYQADDGHEALRTVIVGIVLFFAVLLAGVTVWR